MAISYTCECGKEYRLKDEIAGKRVRCKVCQKVFTVEIFDVQPVDDDEESGFEVVDESPRARKETAVTRAPEVRRPPPPRSSFRDDDHDDDDDERPRPKPRRKRRRRSNRGGSGFPISISPGLIAGALMMLGAVVWFVLGLYFGWIFFYPPILFVLGLVRFVMSLFGHEED